MCGQELKRCVTCFVCGCFSFSMFANTFYFKNVSGNILGYLIGYPYAAQLAMDHTLVLLKFIGKQLEKPAKRAEMTPRLSRRK